MKILNLLVLTMASFGLVGAAEPSINTGAVPSVPISYRVSVARGTDHSTQLKIVLKNEGEIPYYFYEADAPWIPRWLSISIFSGRTAGEQQAKLRSEFPSRISTLDGVGVSGRFITLAPKGEAVGFYPLSELFDKAADLNTRVDLYVGWSFALQVLTAEPYKAAQGGPLETGRVGGFLVLPRFK